MPPRAMEVVISKLESARTAAWREDLGKSSTNLGRSRPPPCSNVKSSKGADTLWASSSNASKDVKVWKLRYQGEFKAAIPQHWSDATVSQRAPIGLLPITVASLDNPNGGWDEPLAALAGTDARESDIQGEKVLDAGLRAVSRAEFEETLEQCCLPYSSAWADATYRTCLSGDVVAKKKSRAEFWAAFLAVLQASGQDCDDLLCQ